MQAATFAERPRDLWRDWFGLAPPPGSSDEPRLLGELRAVDRTGTVFGAQNALLPPQPPNAAGIVPVIAENQGCWCLGYWPTTADPPDGAVFDCRTGEVHLELDHGFDELLYRASFEEAIFLSTNRLSHDIPAAVVDEHLSRHLVVPPLSDFEHYDLPAVWLLDGVLVMGFARENDSLWAGVRDRGAFDASVLPSLGQWFEWTEPA